MHGRVGHRGAGVEVLGAEMLGAGTEVCGAGVEVLGAEMLGAGTEVCGAGAREAQGWRREGGEEGLEQGCGVGQGLGRWVDEEM